MTIECDMENCEYNEDGYCDACGISLDSNGVCMSMRTKVFDDANESMFTDTFSQCDNCPDWVGNKCKSHGHGCEECDDDRW